MRINLQRVMIAVASLVIVALVMIVYLQNQRLEQFMVWRKDTDMTGDTLKTIDNTDIYRCETECQNTQSCKGAVQKTNNNNSCILKSTLGVPVQDSSSISLQFPCELYNGYNFTGKIVPIDVGRYTLTDLQAKGYEDRSLSSLKIANGYKLTIYDENGFGGNKAVFTTSQPKLGVVVRDPTTDPPKKWNNVVRSLVLEKEEVSAMTPPNPLPIYYVPTL